MIIQTDNINCINHWGGTKRKKVFRAVKCVFNYTGGDKALIDALIQKGKDLASKVNSGAANDSFKSRPQQRILNNCIAGVMAEHCWKYYLNDNNTIIRVSETPYTDASAQIDLQILKSNQTIEVRSSFPRNGIPFAICHPDKEFDIIGPYSNNYKPGEIQKDFYLRALFHLRQVGTVKRYDGREYPKIETIFEKIYNPGFEVHLTGGADWAMMADNNISIKKSFIPEDEINLVRMQQATDFRVVPFHNALDTIEVYDRIKAIHC